MQNCLTCQDVCIDYRKLRAVDQLTGSFEMGSMTAIVGPNGGGKSTLLKALKGIAPLSSGCIIIPRINQEQIAYLPQNPDIDRTFPMSVFEVVAMGLVRKVGFFSKFTNQDKEKVMQALKSVGLEDFKDRSIGALSGGQFQRVLFARIFLLDSPLILLDEPFAAIDAPTMEILAKVLQKWCSEGRTIITVLHDLDIVREFFPKTLILARQVIDWGDTKEVLKPETLSKAKAYSTAWEFRFLHHKGAA